MATEFLQKTTIGGERWCDIAQEAYGKASMMNLLVEANPNVPLYDIFPEGVTLDIPIVDIVEVKTDAEQLPPWKR